MQQLCVEEGELKAGLKIALVGTLVKQCSSVLIDQFATSGQKAVADEIRKFREVFAASIHYAKIMAAAEYRLWEKRQTRKPSNLPKEGELGKLLTFIERLLSITTTVKSQSDYVQLCKVVLTRITLLNARRGSEATRLLVMDWVQSHEWVEGRNSPRTMSGWNGSNSPRATRRCYDVTRWRLSWARETISCQCSSMPTAPQHSICWRTATFARKPGCLTRTDSSLRT